MWQFFREVNVKCLCFNWLSLWNYFSMICLVCLKQMAEQLFENGFRLASTLNVSKKLYEYAGQLMVMSLLQGGQNPTIINKSIYKFISSSTALTPEDYEVEPKFYIEQTVKVVCNSQISASFIFCRKDLMNKTKLEFLWKYLLILCFPI